MALDRVRPRYDRSCRQAQLAKSGSYKMVKDLSSLVSLRVDFNFSDPCYVLKLASNYGYSECAGGPVVVAALSNHAIKVFDHATADIRHSMELIGHTDRITDVCIPEGLGPSRVVSSSDDSTVRCWDTRLPTACER
jgi:WD40 repeat protein